MHLIHGITYLEIDLFIPEGFEAESFPLKDNPTTSEYKIHSAEVRTTLFQATKNKKSYILNTFCPSIKLAQNGRPK